MSTALWIALLLAGPTQPAQPTQPTQLDARGLTRRSILEYDTGNYAKALADIEEAYELDPRPALLFNLAQCHRALGHHREAALAFKSYLREVPNAKNREEAADLCATMSELAREDDERARRVQLTQGPASRPPAKPPPPPTLLPEPAGSSSGGGFLPPAPEAAVSEPQSSGHVPAGAWWLGGTGIGVGVIGAILYGVAGVTLGGDNPTTLSSGATEHHLSSGTYFTAATEANTGEVLWGVGGALLVTGVIVALTGSSN